MRKVGMFSSLDLELLYGSVQLATHSWKLWARKDTLPEGHDIETSINMVANLSSLERKLGDLLGAFEGPTEEDLAKIEEILQEEEEPSLDNILQFPNESEE
jgi:hypothetical protein